MFTLHSYHNNVNKINIVPLRILSYNELKLFKIFLNVIFE